MTKINLNWTLTTQERDCIFSKTKNIFNKFDTSPQEGLLIFKSSTLCDDQEGLCTKWYLEMISGKNYSIQLKLCLADADKFAHLDVTYKIVFKTMRYGCFERGSFEGNTLFDTKQTCRISCPDTFLSALYSMIMAENNNYVLIFACDMQIQPVKSAGNILCNILMDYEKLLNDAKYSDFMLVTATKKFNVHKAVLSARSEVFSAMFEHNMKEKKEGFAQIKEFDDEVVQELLRYIYSGKVENLDKLAKDLLVAAEKYLLFDLKILCLEEVCKSIDIDNAVELLLLVDNHNVEHLKSNVMNFIVKNIKVIIGKSNLQTIQNVKVWNEILNRTVNTYL